MTSEIAYTGGQMIFFSAAGILFFGGMTISALRSGRVPRGFGRPILRDKEPKAFWRNIWTGVILTSVCVVGLGAGIAVKLGY